MSEAKSIRILEYLPRTQVPQQFEAQSKGIIWENFEGWQIYTPFTRNLACTYIPAFAQIPINEYRYPIDIYLDFKSFDVAVFPLARQLSWILASIDGVVEGKRILDLGCGSTGGTIDANEFGYQFHPWLCRSLLELGAHPIGVDIGELDTERFEAYGKDLRLPGSLDFISESSIDVVHSRALFTSPQMSSRDEKSLMEILEPQIMRVLRPNGVFIYSKDL